MEERTENGPFYKCYKISKKKKWERRNTGTNKDGN